MKTFTLICLCSMALAAGSFAQSPAGSAPNAAATAASVSPTASASPETEIEKSIRSKHKKHFNINIDGHDLANGDIGDNGDHDIPAAVLPIVALSLLAVFGTPVLIVALIMYFGFSKSRARHRTIRMLVEKGQPVPPELLAPPTPAVRQRSDMRRGVVLMMVGLGLMVFLGAVNDWEGG